VTRLQAKQTSSQVGLSRLSKKQLNRLTMTHRAGRLGIHSNPLGQTRWHTLLLEPTLSVP
jgi:hypothetical protein